MGENGKTTGSGFYPVLAGREVELERGATLLAAGREVEIERGAAYSVLAGEAEIEQGAAALMVAGRSEVEDSFVGVLVSGRTKLEGNARVLMTFKHLLAIGFVVGLIALLRTEPEPKRWWQRS